MKYSYGVSYVTIFIRKRDESSIKGMLNAFGTENLFSS